MNRIHRVLWNAARGCFVAANEATGTRQARGRRLAAAALVAAAFAAGPASSAVVDGVLQPDNGKTTAVYTGADLTSGTVPELNKPVGEVTVVDDGGAGSLTISGLSGITQVHVSDDKTLKLVGTNINTLASFYVYSAQTSNHGGTLQIGETGAQKTTGRFDGCIVAGGIEADGQNWYDGTVRFENADVTVSQLSGNAVIQVGSDAQVNVTTFVTNNGRRNDAEAGLNEGTLTIQTVSSPTLSDGRYKYGEYLIRNKGTLTINNSNASISYINEEGAQANFGNLILNSGNVPLQDPTSAYANRNDGTMTVSSTFILSGLSSRGDTPDIDDSQNMPVGLDTIGRLVNTGSLTIGVEGATGAVANPIADIKGHLMNEGGTVTVHGNLTLHNSTPQYDGKDVELEDRYEARIENTAGGTITVDGNLTYQSGHLINEGTLNVGGTFYVQQFFENVGILTGTGTEAMISVSGNGTQFVSGANGTITGFNANVSGGASLMLNGKAELGKVTLSDGGILYSQAGTNVPTLSSLFIQGTQSQLLVDDTLKVGTLDNKGQIKPLVSDGMLEVTTFTNYGGVDLNSASIDTYSDQSNATASIDNLSISNGNIYGSVDSNSLSIAGGNIYGSVDANSLTVTGVLTIGDGNSTDDGVANLKAQTATIAQGAVLSIGDSNNNRTGLMQVESEESESLLTIKGTVNVNAGELAADAIAVDGGKLELTGGQVTVDTLAGSTGGIVTIASGSKLTAGSLGSTAGMTFNFEGETSQLEVAQGSLENATINLNDRSWTFADAASGFGKNTVNVNAGSEVSFSGAAALGNDTTMTINADGKVTAESIVFDGQNQGSLTLAGGTLVTSLNQIFASVNADKVIEGVDVSTGGTVTIPLSGIQSVGAVKEDLLGEHGLKYDSGTFEFTDDGWTVNAINSASSMLQSAFDKFTGSDSTLVFSGAQEAGGGAFGVEEANKLNSNVVLSGTILSAGKQNLTFGDASETSTGALVTVPVVGFQAIADADSVAVTDGHHLYLTGFEGDDGQQTLLTDTEDGVIQITENGRLTLGLDGHETGGAVSLILANQGQVEVAQNGTFSVGSLRVQGESTVTIGEHGTLNADDFKDSSETQTIVNGTFAIGQQVNLAGALTNNGTVTVASSASFANLDNKGTVETTDAVDGVLIVNEGKIVAGTDAGFVSLTNSGSVSGTSVSVGRHEEAGTLNNQKGGIIEATEGDVTLSLGGKNLNEGSISGSAVSISLAEAGSFTNSGSLAVSGETSYLLLSGAQGEQFVNDGSIEAQNIVVDKLSFTTNSKLTADSLEAVNSELTVGDAGALEVQTLDAFHTTITNNGQLSADVLELANAAVSNNGTLSVTDLVMDADSSVTQAETGTVDVVSLTVAGSEFALGSGTWKIGSMIQFTDDKGAPQRGTVNVNGGKELVMANADVDNVTYNVSRSLTFGTEAGIADRLGIENVNGILTVDKGIELGTGGIINLGSTATALSTRTTTAFTAAAGSVTIFTGNAFGDDGTEAGITAGVEDLSAVIAPEAKAVLTSIRQSGQYKLIEGFDLSANVDADGKWIGGWVGENGKYVAVDNGSDLDWKTEVFYDKDSNTVVADVVAADVRSVYNFATPDIANAALSSLADASKGADVGFMQAVINNKALSVAQTERIVNSVTQIAASLGTSAVFMNDASSLMDSVEARTGYLSDAGKSSGLWVRIEGGKYKMDSLSMAGGLDAGYDTDTYGVTIGADSLTSAGLRIGAAFSYLNGSADADGDVLSGTNDYDTYGIQVYGSWDVTDNTRLMGEIGYFRSANDLAQKISFADVNSASASVDNVALTFGLRGEMRLYAGNAFTLVPHAGVRAVYMMNDEFTTKIDGRDAFRNDQDDVLVFQVPVGVAFEKAFATDAGWSIRPYADVTVAAQFGDTDYETTVTGIGTGVSQAVSADMAGNFIGRAAIGVKAEADSGSLGASYRITAGDAGRQDHAFMVNFSYKF